jgi:hypothetical protein
VVTVQVHELITFFPDRKVNFHNRHLIF